MIFKFACVLLALGSVAEAVISKSAVLLQNNAYTGLVIAINPNVTEDPTLIDAIKNAYTEASTALFTATRSRASFGEVTILLPSTWTSFSTNPRATKETYDKADVLVADPNPSYGDAPYTLQYGGCGSTGSYIHLTPTYLTDDVVANNFGTRAKVIVHEWAHYRWGVFDETSTADPFYNDPQSNTLYDVETRENIVSYTQCAKGLQVCCTEDTNEPCIQDDTSKTWGSQSNCQINPQTGLYSPSCVCYVLNPETEYDASMMSAQYIDGISTFCDDGNNPRTQHNKYAPNDQNRLCDLKSTWAVITESGDFAGGNNPAIPTPISLTPTFTVKIAQDFQRYVLVLDVSGSMRDPGSSGQTRLEQATAAARYFIMTVAPVGSYVGIVTFSSSGDELEVAGLTQLLDSEDRKDLAGLLPTVPGGGTCIGCGILLGMDVLEGLGSAAAGGYLLVLTDGQETDSPTVADTRGDVLYKNVVVETLIIFTSANDDLTSLSIDSGGDWFFAGSDDILSLFDAYSQMAVVEDGDASKKVLQVVSETAELDSSTPYETSANIDFTIGNNTVFTYTWSTGTSAPIITITPPSKTCTIATVPVIPCGAIITTDYSFRTVTISILGRAENGEWFTTVTTYSPPQTIAIVVTSMAADKDTPPITVESSLESIDGNPLVYAKVTQGLNPVLGANVTAILSAQGVPDAGEVELYDAGAYPDIRQNDGVYSRFVTGITTGRYSVKVKVDSAFGGYEGEIVKFRPSSASYNPGFVDATGNISPNPNGQTFLPKDTAFGVTAKELGNFSRQAAAGAIEYTAPPSGPSGDSIPPSKVIDLFVAQNDFTDFEAGIVISFTAPGDDYDNGKANRYDIRYTTGDVDTLLNDFASSDAVSAVDVIEGDINSPSQAGATERLVIATPSYTVGNNTSVSIGFAIKALDEAGNGAKVSNVATLRYYITPPVFAIGTTAQPTTEEPTTMYAETNKMRTIADQADTTSVIENNTTKKETTPSTTILTTEETTRITDDKPITMSASTQKSDDASTLTTTSRATNPPSTQCDDCSETDLLWLYITLPIVVVAGAGVGVLIWLHKSNRWSILSTKGSVSPVPSDIDNIETGSNETPEGISMAPVE